MGNTWGIHRKAGFGGKNDGLIEFMGENERRMSENE
jgi:hypothetical protein